MDYFNLFLGGVVGFIGACNLIVSLAHSERPEAEFRYFTRGMLLLLLAMAMWR